MSSQKKRSYPTYVNRTVGVKPSGDAMAPSVAPQKTAQTGPAAAVAGGGHVVGKPSFMAPGLRPIARAMIQSRTIQIQWNASLGAVFETFQADPVGTSTFRPIPVDNWTNRFAGFQQYRIRATHWEVIPLRANVGTATSSQAQGFVQVWINDTSTGASPTPVEAAKVNSEIVHANTDKVLKMTYSTNEPQDLNLTDINSSPSHVDNGALFTGQHDLLIYGDSSTTGLVNGSLNVALYSVRCYYDIEFFGVGFT
jgi:hypothetical protein